jgi:NADH-quinone oxidoreductase subunit M
VLGAGYMLRFARVILYGKVGENKRMDDLNPREALAFLPLLALILWIGVHPAPFMVKVQGGISQLQAQVAASNVLPQTATTTSVNGGVNGQ